MKKVTFSLLALLLTHFSFSQMIVHGTSSTLFYLFSNNTIYSIYGNELWENFPYPGETQIDGRVLTQQTTYPAPIIMGEEDPADLPDPDENGYRFWSCTDAQNYWGQDFVECGPYSETYPTPTTVISKCNKTSYVACKIVTANCTYISDNGNFF